jgi:acetyl-CoA acetyltransferase
MSLSPHTICFAGVGASAIERRSDRGILAFALDAALNAIRDAGLSRDDIDGYVGAPLATNAGALHVDGADEISARRLVDGLGIRNLAWGIDLSNAFPTDMAIAAAQALLSGACRTVLCVRALHNPAGVSYATGHAEQAFGEDQFRTPFGYAAAGARFATRARSYLERAGASRRDLFDVVALARSNARLNPRAIWRDRAVSLDEYLDAPLIAEPLGRLDCDMPVCGAGAVVMTLARNAPAGGRNPVYLAGWAGWQRPCEIFVRSNRRREDIGVCQLYDGFSSMIFEWLEGLGWCERHTAWKFIKDGHAARDGRLPLNTFGGSLGEGRLHGMGHLQEAILQVGGRADARQVPRADNCLVQVGPYDSSSFLIVSASPS